ncbi:GNAT family N-acetyltransferase [Reinekea marina]|uniref:GNAT family N-acetyltransferase n=1 Tax=Reinekea marina TaxID=1310421 RepID=A0ABV7WRQ0_9GAMM|nr:GNAT family N-acetyltransferase [Reinekea marina]MDN3648139.1 GNAT family N-acetyltransferase [Reinekea marina]
MHAYIQAYKNFGLKALLTEIANSVLSKVGIIKIEKIFTLPCQQVQVNIETAICINQVSFDELESLRQAQEISISPSDSERVKNNKVLCFIARKNEQLVGIDWFAIEPYQHSPGVMACFNERWVCEYGLWLHPSCRGQGVRRLILNAAMPMIHERGKEGIVVGIFWNNFASIRSSKKLGYKPKGLSYWNEHSQQGRKASSAQDYWLQRN